MKCDICGTKTETSFRSGVINGRYISRRCEICFGLEKMGREVSPLSAQYKREREREDGARDIVQPFINGKPNPEFAHAYKDRAKDYFTEAELSQM